MSFELIIELHALPGRRGEVISILDRILSTMDEVPGFMGLTRYEVVDDPKRIVEIAERESAQARAIWIKGAERSALLKPLQAVLASPSTATSIRRLD